MAVLRSRWPSKTDSCNFFGASLFHRDNRQGGDNGIGNRSWINDAKEDMANYFRRRGMVFVDGKPPDTFEGIDTDFLGHASAGTRLAGPFSDLGDGFKSLSVDPRK
jgi:hypothetical protein